MTFKCYLSVEGVCGSVSRGHLAGAFELIDYYWGPSTNGRRSKTRLGRNELTVIIDQSTKGLARLTDIFREAETRRAATLESYSDDRRLRPVMRVAMKSVSFSALRSAETQLEFTLCCVELHQIFVNTSAQALRLRSK